MEPNDDEVQICADSDSQHSVPTLSFLNSNDHTVPIIEFESILSIPCAHIDNADASSFVHGEREIATIMWLQVIQGSR